METEANQGLPDRKNGSVGFHLSVELWLLERLK